MPEGRARLPYAYGKKNRHILRKYDFILLGSLKLQQL